MAVKTLMTDETGMQIVEAIREKADMKERVYDLEKNKVDKSSIAQTTGTAEDKVMSQKAATEELEKKFDKSNVAQSTGDDEDKVMSQAAATKEFGKLSEEIDGLNNHFDLKKSKNLINPSILSVGYVDETTGVVNSGLTTQSTSDFVEIGTDAVLSFGYNFLSNGTLRVVLYDEDKNYLSGSKPSLTLDSDIVRHYVVLQTGGAAKYVRISTTNITWEAPNFKVQVENGTKPTNYEEYFEPYRANLREDQLPPSVFDAGDDGTKIKESALPDALFDKIEQKNIVDLSTTERHIRDFVARFTPLTDTTISVTPPTGVGKLVHCGKNLFDESQLLNFDGIQKNSEGYFYGFGSRFDAVLNSLILPKFKPHTTYVLSYTAYSDPDNMYWGAGFAYEDGTTRITSRATATPTRIVATSTPPTYIQTGYSKVVTGLAFGFSNGGILYIKDIQIEEAREVSEYEPFRGDVYDYADTQTVEIVAKSGVNSVYCTGGMCTVNYRSEKIGGGDKFTAVCVGDSITGNYTNPTDYPSFMHERTGINAINAGFGGCRMSLHTDAERQYFSFCSLADAIVSGDFKAQYTAAEAENIYNVYDHIMNIENTYWNEVDYLVVFFGTNDYTAGVVIDNEDNPYDTSTYIGAFRYGVEKIWSKYPHIRILAVTPMYRYFDNGADSDTQQYGGNYLHDYGEALKNACKEYKTPCLDMYHNSGVNAITRQYYIEDGTHPTEAGRKNIGYIIADCLNAMF